MYFLSPKTKFQSTIQFHYYFVASIIFSNQETFKMKQSLGVSFVVFLAMTFHKSSTFVLNVALNIQAYADNQDKTLSVRWKHTGAIQGCRPVVTHRFAMLDPNDLGGSDSTAPFLEAAHNFMVQAFNVEDVCTRIITSVTGIQKIIEYIHGGKAPHEEEYNDRVLVFYCQDMHHCSLSQCVTDKGSIGNEGNNAIKNRGDLRISLLIIGKDIYTESTLWEALLLAQNNGATNQQHSDLDMNFDIKDNKHPHRCQRSIPSLKIQGNSTYLKFYRERDQPAILLPHEKLKNLTLSDFLQLELEHESPFCLEVITE